jgi:hypothetical protein
MSFGAGHIQDMINRMKQNRSQRPSSRPKFKSDYLDVIDKGTKPASINFKKVPLEKLRTIKKSIRTEAHQRHKKQRINLFIFIVISLIIFSCIVIGLNIEW